MSHIEPTETNKNSKESFLGSLKAHSIQRGFVICAAAFFVQFFLLSVVSFQVLREANRVFDLSELNQQIIDSQKLIQEVQTFQLNTLQDHFNYAQANETLTIGDGAVNKMMTTVHDHFLKTQQQGLSSNIDLTANLGKAQALWAQYKQELLVDKQLAKVTFKESVKNYSEIHRALLVNAEEIRQLKDNALNRQKRIHFLPPALGGLAAFLILIVFLKVFFQVKSQEQELEETIREVNELNIIKDRFVSTVSHELRTPLTAILGFSKLVAKNLDTFIVPLIPEEKNQERNKVLKCKQSVEIIAGESERLTNMITDFLDIAKMKSGEFEFRKTETDLLELLESTSKITENLFEQANLNFRCELPDSCPTLFVDQGGIKQVLINLLSNASKFTESGDVVLSLEVLEGFVKIGVQDDGMGIADEDLNEVFKEFKQVGNVLTNKPKGTGLGLPICRKIVHWHEGEIWVESKTGNGSKFCFTLPIKKYQTN